MNDIRLYVLINHNESTGDYNTPVKGIFFDRHSAYEAQTSNHSVLIFDYIKQKFIDVMTDGG